MPSDNDAAMVTMHCKQLVHRAAKNRTQTDFCMLISIPFLADGFALT